MNYTTEDLIRAFLKAREDGPEAERQFRDALNKASFEYLNFGVPLELACFELFADLEKPKEKTN